jgi:aminoglycoside phosphotransferase (APT) family kinase protein
MHADEIEIGPELVAELLREQFPDWSDLPLARVPSGGTDNALYRLGDDLLLRFPRRPDTAAMVDKELRWLPRIAPLLPLAVPTPFAAGEPTHLYPSAWSVSRWIQGDDATVAHVADSDQATELLARFVVTMRGLDLPGGPEPGAHNFFRGEHLAARDEAVREALIELGDQVDGPAATAAWERALAAPAWDRAPAWFHGDLHGANLLVRHGRLYAVIDFGSLGVGDPACDLMVAWTYLVADQRARFRALVDADDAMWERGRGWALSLGLIALPYYSETNPVMAGIARRAIAAALGADLGGPGSG